MKLYRVVVRGNEGHVRGWDNLVKVIKECEESGIPITVFFE